MLKRIIGGALAFGLTAMLAPVGTAWAGEAPTRAPATGVSVVGTPGQLVPGDQAGEMVEGPDKTLVVAGGHIRIDNGFYYTIPVHYVKFDWSYTWKLKKFVNNRSGTLATLCGYLPSKLAVAACSGVYTLFRNDVNNTVNAAIAHRKCYKVRLPVTAGGASLAAYDSYYVTC